MGRYPEILSHLTALSSELLEQEGRLSKPEAEKLACLIADRIGQDLAGQQVYFGRQVTLTARDREIFRNFNGSNHSQLAYKYRLSERQVYSIIARVRAEEIRRRRHGE